MSNLEGQSKDLVDLVRQFISLAEDMREKGILSDEQFLNLTQKKREYLNEHGYY